jgi:hypothetical protein
MRSFYESSPSHLHFRESLSATKVVVSYLLSSIPFTALRMSVKPKPGIGGNSDQGRRVSTMKAKYQAEVEVCWVWAVGH